MEKGEVEKMDPVTHGLVGMMLGIMGGGTLSLTNSVMTASIVGSILPDLDIVFQMRGDYAYLKQHRGFSHSLPCAVLASGVVTFFLGFIYPGEQFSTLFWGSLLGFLSHLFLDLLNSYGVKILWPFSRKKYTWNLLPLFDPILVLLCVISLFFLRKGVNEYSLLAVIFFYLLLRRMMRFWAKSIVRARLQRKNELVRVNILPSGISLFQWDFIAVLPGKNIVGTINLCHRKYQIFQHLYQEGDEFKGLLAKTILGQVFHEFTPFCHINYEKKGGKLVCHFIDLRYRVRDRFLHNGVLVLDQNLEVEEAIFQPYSKSHGIYLTQ